jgi:hypothetical protein
MYFKLFLIYIPYSEKKSGEPYEIILLCIPKLLKTGIVEPEETAVTIPYKQICYM